MTTEQTNLHATGERAAQGTQETQGTQGTREGQALEGAASVGPVASAGPVESVASVASAASAASAANDPIAIVGLSCRLPGAPDADSYWDLLKEGRSAITEAPADRWDADALYDSDITTPGKINSRYGGFLDRDSIVGFDARFFGIGPREALAMDPQQRLLLELSWEAFEDARIVPDELSGSRTSVFVGSIWNDFATLLNRGGLDAITRHSLTGVHRSIIANRISYTYGLRGPSLAVDSGQSSSLVAVHLACESLRNGENTLAIAGGVNLNLAPESQIASGKLGGYSPDGRCFTFDARANGYVRGEGGAVVVLKPLSRALADGDRVHAVIRGSAVNNDGGGHSLSSPSRQGQEELLRQVYERSGVSPSEVRYVELHGTGTPVGDPIEAAALGAALGGERAADAAPLHVGSVKTNIGHLEGAAGIAGLLKTVLSLTHRELPASLNFESPNPQIPLEELNLRVHAEHGAWPGGDGPLVAGVSSFGMGGTNAHVIVEEAPATGADVAGPAELGVVPWVVSGKSAVALREQALRLGSLAGADPVAVGRALVSSRARFDHRAVLIGGSVEELLAGARALAAGEPSPFVVSGQVRAGAGRTVLVFPGQGSQWAGMAVELAAELPVFRERLDECAVALAEFTDWGLWDVLNEADDTASLERVDVVQPVLWAVMVSLAAAWAELGVVPDAVVGHSQGEIAAATVAGVLTLEDGARITALRSKALTVLAGTGGMVSVPLPAAEVQAHLDTHAPTLTIATINGPASTVIAGDVTALEEVLAHYEAADVRARRIDVDYASHTPHIDQLQHTLAELLAPVTPQAVTDIAFYSTVTGERVTDTTTMDAAYWYQNLRGTVRFETTTRTLLADGYRLFIESSPHPVLTIGIQDTTDTETASDATVIGTLRRQQGTLTQLLTSAAHAHTTGTPINWTRFLPKTSQTVDLPTYPFQHQEFPLPSGGLVGSTSDGTAPPVEPSDLPQDAPDSAPALVTRLAGMPRPEQEKILLDMVRSSSAIVLGHASSTSVDNDRSFKEQGFDSLGAVELRNRIGEATGLRLPPTGIFNYPTPNELARHLLSRLVGGDTSPLDPLVRPSAVADEPVAIVGMACRFPGGVSSPEELWRLVAEGTDVISGFPTNRGWDLDGLYDPDSQRAGSTYTRHGGFLYEADEFDPEFFGISPREALAMDPQQRLLLETAWEALERSGIAPDSLVGEPAGVFIGTMAQEYGPRLAEPVDNLGGYLLTGGSISAASGRIAYSLGLKGPAVSVDTACSSSLVALHMAAQSLRQGESSLALAGGVTVMSSPGLFVEFSRQRGLSADGRCKPFADAADGTGWGEGAGLLVLERLSDAERHGHRVLAVLRGSAVNQDGASNGLTAPNGPSQERVIRQALAGAGLTAAEVDAVEAHGTGTRLGDPIEAQALLATYGQNRPDNRPLYLGSIKSNIGHTQAAAGVAGVIKMVMAMQAGVLPQSLHVDTPSRHVDWTAGAVEILTEARPWLNDRHPRRAGISSFGVSGTNAHVIIEEVPPAEPASGATTLAPCPAVVPWVMSARSAVALREQALRLGSLAGADPVAVGRALVSSRARFDHRAVLIGGSVEELLSGARALAAGEPSPFVVSGQVASGTGRTVLVFPGQGSQWAGMAVELAAELPVFRERLDECAVALGEFTDWGLWDVLNEAEGAASLERVDVVQPVLWAVMVSLAAAWAELGVVPDAVVGHSQGEIAAATVAGVLTLEDGARITALRSKALTALAGTGGMVSVPLPAAEVQAHLDTHAPTLTIATINGPASTVIAGDVTALEEVLAHYEAADVRARRIDVDYASHTPHIDQLQDTLAELLAPVTPQAVTDIAFYSTVTGERVTDTTTMDAAYWYQNLRGTVRFETTTRALLADGYRLFIESSPHPVLTIGIQDTTDTTETPATVIGTLRRQQGTLTQLVVSAAHAHTTGTPINWTRFLPQSSQAVDLPTYPFQRESYWLKSSSRLQDATSLGLSGAEHALLGARIDLADTTTLFTGRLSLSTHPWLADHAVAGTVLLPGAALVDLALHAGLHTGHPHLTELTLHAPLILDPTTPRQLHLTLEPAHDGTRTLIINSRTDTDTAWVQHADGTLTQHQPAPPQPSATWPPPGAEPVDVTGLYDDLHARGYHYGPTFQGLTTAWKQDNNHYYADITLPENTDTTGHTIHPALLDAALHTALL
ncbi:type I polyketide synthase, partial [Streptomyces sp. NPDC057307]|uniref:type I polyketide synthase n=1 Tax=Streptomyces sp. NPDC057307 TaxID=3346096 RepID=UPI00363535D4